MAKETMAAKLQTHKKRLINFLNFTKAYLIKNNPIKKLLSGTKTYFKELTGVKNKIKTIRNRINYEKYKLKKTELILAQNTEHVFLRGRSLNQTR